MMQQKIPSVANTAPLGITAQQQQTVQRYVSMKNVTPQGKPSDV